MKKDAQGFTLIEMLLAFAILSILSIVVISVAGTMRMQQRDTQRKHDIKQLRTAIEAHFSDVREYPLTNRFGNCGVTAQLGSPGGFPPIPTVVYMAVIPCDPEGSSVKYFYVQTSDKINYCLRACLENSEDVETDVKRYGVNNAPLTYCTTAIMTTERECGTNRYSISYDNAH